MYLANGTYVKAPIYECFHYDRSQVDYRTWHKRHRGPYAIHNVRNEESVNHFHTENIFFENDVKHNGKIPHHLFPEYIRSKNNEST